MLGSKTSQLGVRVAITIGVFAFLFTFTPSIKDMKPVTDSPTIADVLVILIIVSTVVFTISSIIGNIAHRKYPNGSKWVDRGAFFLLLGVVVYYLIFNYNYPLDLIWWLIPIIAIGLGYGLLFRVKVRLDRVRIFFKH